MSKRMNFSVVGLPNYTIWHLYEPSVDDIRHMEEMERERKAKEAEEAAKQERLKKINEQFDNPGNQWKEDWTAVQASVEGKKQEGQKFTGTDKERPKEPTKANGASEHEVGNARMKL